MAAVTISREDEFYIELDKDIDFHERKKRVFLIIHWTVAILVAMSGFISAGVAATPGTFRENSDERLFYQHPYVLIVCGLITVVGTVINQFSNPVEKVARHTNMVITMFSIRGAVRYQGLPVAEGQRLRILAQINPLDALKELPGVTQNPVVVPPGGSVTPQRTER